MFCMLHTTKAFFTLQLGYLRARFLLALLCHGLRPKAVCCSTCICLTCSKFVFMCHSNHALHQWLSLSCHAAVQLHQN